MSAASDQVAQWAVRLNTLTRTAVCWKVQGVHLARPRVMRYIAWPCLVFRFCSLLGRWLACVVDREINRDTWSRERKRAIGVAVFAALTMQAGSTVRATMTPEDVPLAAAPRVSDSVAALPSAAMVSDGALTTSPAAAAAAVAAAAAAAATLDSHDVAAPPAVAAAATATATAAELSSNALVDDAPLAVHPAPAASAPAALAPVAPGLALSSQPPQLGHQPSAVTTPPQLGHRPSAIISPPQAPSAAPPPDPVAPPPDPAAPPPAAPPPTAPPPTDDASSASTASSSLSSLSSLVQLARMIRRGDHVVFVTGSGLSAPSGIPTFRGEGGVWARFVLEWGTRQARDLVITP